MSDAPRQPRNFKDRALVWISGLLAGARVPLVQGAPRLLHVVDSRMWDMAPAKQETDRTLLAEDGSIWTFEFQFRESEADYARMAGYYLTLFQQHPGRSIHTVVFWGQRQPPERPLCLQQVIFNPRQVFLQSLLAEAELERWRLRAQARIPLDREAALELAMLPLMRHTVGMRDLLDAALPVSNWLEQDLRDPVRAAMLCLGYSDLRTDTDREWARRELLNMPVVGQELFEDLIRDGLEKGRQEGRQEGVLHQAQKAVLEAFTARFDAAPVSVCDVVAKTSDLELLTRWHRTVVRAPDAAAAAAAVLDNL